MSISKLKVSNIREAFKDLYFEGEIAENNTYEILNASFIADEPTIFGVVDYKYAAQELTWYVSQSRNVNDIPGKIPQIWKDVATENGFINSNYGWCIWSQENGSQFHNAVLNLVENKYSRQATMIYNRPSMHADATREGMKDFVCTNTAQLFIRNDTLHYIVNMRSNDAVFGYKNDRHWHDFVFDAALKELQQTYPEIVKGDMYWNANTLHIYPRHFKLIK